jgi:hypothetical protein
MRGRHRVPGLVVAGVVIASVLTVLSSPAPVLAGAQGSLPSVNPKVVRDGDRWVSVTDGVSLSAPGARACNPSDTTWSDGFAHVPYRVGPAPAQMEDCWSGDAMPDGPAAWADRAAGSVTSPTLAQIGTNWWLAYTAIRAGTGQRCIGLAVSNAPTGPAWIHAGQPLVCPAGGLWAGDPELFYDRQAAAWFLLWRDEANACDQRIRVQRFDPSTGLLTGTPRELLVATTPALGFDEVGGWGLCPGGLRHDIGSPAMVRADSGELWLLFSANDPASANYATGWALCGGGAPTEGTSCVVPNALDPASRYKPMWGARARTAPQPGVDASPVLGFPDLPGFGGLSLAVANPTAAGTQPVHAVSQFRWPAAPNPRLQFSTRLDTTSGVPALFDSAVVQWHGAPGTFGNLPNMSRTVTGQSLSTRAVDGFAWPPGRDGIFNEVTADGTIFVSGNDQNAGFFGQSADDLVVGAYDPRYSSWTNVKVRTSGGSETIAPLPSSQVSPERWGWHPEVWGEHLAGASVGDVQAVDNGNAVLFSTMVGYPFPYYDRPAPAEGVWPTFGIISRGPDNRWQVRSGPGWTNQWTGAQIAATVPRNPAQPTVPSVSERACPPMTGHPAGFTSCRGPNEMALLPASRDVIVALYAGDGGGAGTTGLMSLRITPGAGGRYDVRVTGFYQLPVISNPVTPDPNDHIIMAAKSVEVDPTSTVGDERFVLLSDLFTEDDGNPDTIPFYAGPSTAIEFSYDSRTGAIRPVSAPVLGPDRETPTSGLSGIGVAKYDTDGNLWTFGRRLTIYAKENGQRRITTPQCFDPAVPMERQFFRDTVTGAEIWGRVCQPHYEFDQFTTTNPFVIYQLAEDPATKTMVVQHTFVSADLHAIRRTGTGANMSFTISQVTEPGRRELPKIDGGVLEQRPGVFDRTGRYWFSIDHRPPQRPEVVFPDGPDPGTFPDKIRPGVVPRTPAAHWIASVDVASLFESEAAMLPSTAIEAEHSTTAGTMRTIRADGTAVISPLVRPRPCSVIFGCPGYEVERSASSPGPVDHLLWAPTAGAYRLSYFVNGAAGATISASIDGGAPSATSVATAGAWTTVPGPTVQLRRGTNRLRLSSPAGSGTWALGTISVTR